MQLFSVHVAKAGGTALRDAFRNAFGEGFLADYADDPANPLSPRNLDPGRHLAARCQAPQEVRCVHGHFHPAKYAIGPDDYLFTLLREPVDNLLSIYFFWKTLPRSASPLHCYFLDNDLSLTETARLPTLRWLFSRTYFGGFDMARFNLVGRHEARAEALSRLSADIGVTIGRSGRVNETPPSPERDAAAGDTRLRSLLGNILSDDIRFYEAHAR